MCLSTLHGLTTHVNTKKIVYGNQLKCTIAHVYEDSPRLINDDGTVGDEIDGIFSGKSLYARIVNSPFQVGMANILLLHIGKSKAKRYFELKNKGK